MKWMGKKPQGMFNREGLWIRSPEGIYNIMKLDFANNTLRGVTLNKISKDFVSTGSIRAKSAKWVNDRWVAIDAREFVITDKGATGARTSGDIDLPLKMSVDDFFKYKSEP